MSNLRWFEDETTNVYEGFTTFHGSVADGRPDTQPPYLFIHLPHLEHPTRNGLLRRQRQDSCLAQMLQVNDDYPCCVDKVDGIGDAKNTYDERTTGRTCKCGDGARQRRWWFYRRNLSILQYTRLTTWISYYRSSLLMTKPLLPASKSSQAE
jgi:hypothetical protein